MIKVASTWEVAFGAVELLQKEGIKCNLTLLFSVVQAVACAEAKVQLISPFVGRIYDWYKKAENRDFKPAEDPGVKVPRLFIITSRSFGHKTEAAGASFRNTGQILELAGCDLLTISPKLLGELQKSEDKVERKLSAEAAQKMDIKQVPTDEKHFRWLLNEETMATEKLSEGIRLFAADSVKLDTRIAELLHA